MPRDLRREIPGRLDAHGNELEPLDRQAVVAMARSLADAGATSIAVCLLHAYASPRHEQQVHAWIRQALPDVSLTLSSEVAPVIREFERGSTTVANAYIKPLADRYLAALEDKLATLGLRSGVLMMLSNGGLGHLRQARRNPIELLESGPAGGRSPPPTTASATSSRTCWLRHGRHHRQADPGGRRRAVHRPQFRSGAAQTFRRRQRPPIGITTVHLIEIGAGGAASRIRTNCNCSRSAP